MEKYVINTYESSLFQLINPYVIGIVEKCNRNFLKSFSSHNISLEFDMTGQKIAGNLLQLASHILMPIELNILVENQIYCLNHEHSEVRDKAASCLCSMTVDSKINIELISIIEKFKQLTYSLDENLSTINSIPFEIENYVKDINELQKDIVSTKRKMGSVEYEKLNEDRLRDPDREQIAMYILFSPFIIGFWFITIPIAIIYFVRRYYDNEKYMLAMSKLEDHVNNLENRINKLNENKKLSEGKLSKAKLQTREYLEQRRSLYKLI